MSTEFYFCCHECKKKVHVGCVGFSGFQLWYANEQTGKALKELLSDCMLHSEKIGFIPEQTHDDYEEFKIPLAKDIET
jgi:hypothetical protein